MGEGKFTKLCLQLLQIWNSKSQTATLNTYGAITLFLKCLKQRKQLTNETNWKLKISILHYNNRPAVLYANDTTVVLAVDLV